MSRTREAQTHLMCKVLKQLKQRHQVLYENYFLLNTPWEHSQVDTHFLDEEALLLSTHSMQPPTGRACSVPGLQQVTALIFLFNGKTPKKLKYPTPQCRALCQPLWTMQVALTCTHLVLSNPQHISQVPEGTFCMSATEAKVQRFLRYIT